MKSFKISALLVLLALLPACGQQLVELDEATTKITDTTPAAVTVTATDPVRGATDVPLNATVSATFSEAMDPATISDQSFTVKQGATAVTGTVTYTGTTATFSPGADLLKGAVYTAQIGTAASSSKGVAMLAAHKWSFTAATHETLAPTVVSTDPEVGEEDVVLNKLISATFSEDMDPDSINELTFKVTAGVTQVDGIVTYSGLTATFEPDLDLAAETVFTATITTDVMDLAGTPMAAEYTWLFTTGMVPDVTAPTVVATNPVSDALNVSISKELTVWFSETMDPASITDSTFTLQDNLGAFISGEVNYMAGSTVATFSPDNDFALGVTYTATITTGALDSAGTPMASDYSWVFETSACNMSGVELGNVHGFAVLGGQSVDNTGVLTSVTGDVGVSPGTSITGFLPGQIDGSVYAGDTVSQAAMASLQTAYDDANGRVAPAGCPTVDWVGNLGGQTFGPALYTSTSHMEITGVPLTLDAEGDSNAVFIFKMASTFTVGDGMQVILAGGAKAANIFWLVGSSATLGTTAVVHGTIMADQSVTLNTGATLKGRALARIASVTLDDSEVTLPAE